jgi:8-oxo-dGTP pyrophosphatase MutT (NUDIX family)
MFATIPTWNSQRLVLELGVLILNARGQSTPRQAPRRLRENASSELKGAGTWTMPGGSLDFGESFEDAAKRETKEETGLTLGKVEVIALNADQTDTAHYVTIGLLGRDFTGEPQVCEPEKITCWQWFDPTDLPSPMYEPSKKLLTNFLHHKFYSPD